MAKLQPFRAFRPKPGLEEKISSPPYDVLDSDEARTLVQNNPYSFLHVIKPEIDLPVNISPYDEIVYQKAKENFNKMIDAGYFIREEKPAFYLYRQIMDNHTQIGLVAGVSVDEYEKNLIKKHELTRKDKEDDRTKHVDTVNANTGPVFLTYKADGLIDEIINEIISSNNPVYDFIASDKIRHTVWVVGDSSKIDLFINTFKKIPALYIADGHHRSASAARVKYIRKINDPNPTGEKVYDYFMAVIFPHNQLKILDYNRIVKDLNGLSDEEFLQKISEKFEVRNSDGCKPDRPKVFKMYLNGKWFELHPLKGTFQEDDPVENLDVAILQNNLLDPILGIHDPRTDKRISFIGGIKGINALKEKVDNFKKGVAFALYPTSINELMAIADAGKIMPPKSTWFEPKLRSGILVRSLKDI